MEYTSENIRQLIEQACDILIKNDSQLFDKGVNERTLTHRLAVYLESLFPEWNVDCEYNKNGREIKKIPHGYLDKPITSRNLDGITIYPDIIIHKRGKNTPGNNLVVIEAKKDKDSRRKGGVYDDISKLEAYKDELNYKHPFFLMFQLTEKKYKLLTLKEAQKEYESSVRNRH